jgi:hypothetical protein
MSPFLGRHHQDQIIEAIGFTNPRQVLDTRSAQSVKHGRRGPKEWLCSHGYCDKRYRRLQELKRHITDKHAIQSKCPICGYSWTRPEKIRSHLTDQHQHHFTEEERQEIRTLRGRKDTTSFLLAKCRTLTLPGGSIFRP